MCELNTWLYATQTDKGLKIFAESETMYEDAIAVGFARIYSMEQHKPVFIMRKSGGLSWLGVTQK